MMPNYYTFGNYQFVLTCTRCPEKYDVCTETGEKCGYIRIDDEDLKCYYPCYGGELIYFAEITGLDSFKDDEERFFHLGKIAEVIKARAALVVAPQEHPYLISAAIPRRS
jgi:hypothetical protein